MNRFDADTALEPAGEGRVRATVSRSWFVADGPNGGFIAALAVRALRETVPDLPPRSLTLHFLVAPAEGPVELACAIVRRGRTTAFLRLELIQDGAPVVLGLAACAPWRPDAPSFADVAPAPLADPDDCVRVEPGRPGQPAFLANYDLRLQRPDPAARPTRLAGWIRAAQARPLDEVLLAAMTDAFLPPAMVRLPEPVAVPTVDLTIHFRAPRPADAHPWVAAEFVSTLAAGGTTEEDGRLWLADGTLVAQSRQLAVVRRLPAAA